MHIAFFSDQHPATLGGLQVSLGLQRAYLERRGHLITVVAPRSKRPRSMEYTRPYDVITGATQVGEHSFSLAGPRFDAAIDAAFLHKPRVDCVHIQGDIWGAWNGYRFAARHDLPVVHTMHTNIEVGLPAILPFSRAVFRLLFAAQRRYMDVDEVRSIADYTRVFADRADVLVAPSEHFARQLHGYGIDRDIAILPTGVDDDLVAEILSEPRETHSTPLLLWPGRISREKGILDFFEAFRRARVDANVHVYGSGNDEARAHRMVADLGLSERVRFFGAVPHREVIAAMHGADLVVQTSVDYETQCLTIYESVAVGTPVILRDRGLGVDLPESLRHAAPDASIAALSRVMREQVERVRGGAPRPEPAGQFTQSQRSREAEQLYAEALRRHAQHRGDGSPWGDRRAG